MFDNYNRPDWDSYFISLCFHISRRSLDPATQCGCVAVDDEHTILSTGYNSPPRGCDESTIPLTRPEKYPYMEHAEANVIINAARNGVALKGSTFFVTTQPCENCFRKIMGVGAKKVVFAGVGAKCLNAETMKVIEKLNPSWSKNHVVFEQYKDDGTVAKLLENTVAYHKERGKV